MFIGLIKNNKLFENIEKSDLNLLLTGQKPESKQKGEIIYKEGDLGQSVFLLIQGEVILAKERFLGRSKKETKFDNDFFGEESYLEKSPRPFTAIAQTEIQFVEIEKSKLDLLASINPRIIPNLKRIPYVPEINEPQKKEEIKSDLKEENILNEKKSLKEENLSKEIPFQEDFEIHEDEKFEIEENKNFGEVLNSESELSKIVNENFSDEKPEEKIPETNEEKIEDVKVEPAEISAEKETPAEKANFVENEIPVQTEVAPVEIPQENKTEISEEEKLKELLQIAEKLNSKNNADEVILEFLQSAEQITNCENADWYFVNEETKEIYNAETKVKFGEGDLGKSAANNEIINIKKYKPENVNSGNEIKNMLFVPVETGEKNKLGILQLVNSKKNEFDKNDIELIQLILPNFLTAYFNSKKIDELLHSEKINALEKMSNLLDQDIKKPIFISKRYADHIKSKNLPEETASLLNMLLDQLNFVADVIQTTTNYSEGKTILRTVIQPLNETLNEYIEKIQPQITMKKCVIEKKFGEDAAVKIDRKELYQSFLSIIRNACEAMPEGGKILVSTETNLNDVVKISVKDEGIGIAGNLKDKIFEPFVSINKKENAGLGLSISKKIIEDHGGKIEVKSELEKGSEFVIILPKENL